VTLAAGAPADAAVLDGPLADSALGTAVTAWLDLTAWPVLVYFLLINTSYLVLICLAAVEFARHLRRIPFAGFDETCASPLTLPVSVLVPAYNEAAGIVASVSALLALRYPVHEVVVVDDGSTDDTFTVLAAAHDLVEVPRPIPQAVPTRGRVLSVHAPRDGRTPLLVVRTENSGRSDALNVGVNAARHDLVCFVDADSILDPEALLTVAKPFADDPLRVVATGGVVRAANGCRVVAGRVVEARMPAGWLARIQVVEYLRAFLLGRTGWSRLGSLVLISGAFGLYRRDVVVEVGGLDPDCIGEDFELCVQVHRLMRDQRREYRVVFVAEPVAWTEVPSTARVLASQRRRWHRGLWEVLWRHRRMIGNPRYGRIGLVALPYYVVFELFAPVLELVGAVVVPLGLALGVVRVDTAVAFLLVAYAYAVLVSLAALAVEEFSFHRYGRWRDLAVAGAVTVVENLGYRQLTAWWRVQGLWAAWRGSEQVWGVMTRQGFSDEVATGTGAR
jgi:cellulose synthase/poly-beta-1,6-N-acetylglucosamine synthase-like glycosyltransferase